jgi:chaperone required for assembly of F1-ATPase
MLTLRRIGTNASRRGAMQASALYCSSASAPPASSTGAAPKKARASFRGAGVPDTNAASAKQMQPKAEGRFSTDELARRLEELESMDPQHLLKLRNDFEAKEQAESRVLTEDNIYQLDVSTSTRQQGALKVFWKEVDITEADGAGTAGWYKITLDGRKVKAFENANQLIVPSRDYALAVAHEFGTQTGHLNKLLMPLTDLASGAMLVSAQGIPARVDYLMSFFMTDNCYFRSESIAADQDALIDPIVSWFDRVFDVHSPRIVGIGHPKISVATAERVRQQLLDMNLNQHQIVSLCVVAQFTASLMLPLAMFHGIVPIDHGLKVNRAEEGHNVSTHGEIKGYHDIREADNIVKVAAAVTAWQLTAALPIERYAVLSTMVQ